MRSKAEIVSNLINNDVYVNQTSLVESLLGSESDLSYENVVNLYDDVDEDYDLDGDRFEPEVQEIFEWWAVSTFLADQLEKIGAPVLRSDFGDWFGRTETGQSLSYDSSLNAVADTIANS